MIKIGRKIKTKEIERCSGNVTNTTWTVKEIYPHHILCENRKGLCRCFCYGELIQMKLVKQSKHFETLKHSI